MSKISLCMIVKNESSILQKCLESVYNICDEIVIVDTGSTDNTVQIAKKFTDKVYDFEWVDDFSAARNFALKYCSNEYVLTWDADYILESESKKLILNLKNNNFDGKNLLFFRWFTEFNELGQGTRSMWREFVFKRSDFHWESAIHNYLEPNSNIQVNRGLYVSIKVQHWKDSTVKVHRYKQTRDILEQQLSKKLNPKTHFRLLLFHAQSLIFDKEYFQSITELNQVLDYSASINDNQTAIFVLEKLVTCWLNLNESEQAKSLFDSPIVRNLPMHPRLVLLQADVAAIENIQKAKELYIQFLNQKYKFDTEVSFDWDSERMEAHPYFLLGKICLLQNNPKDAKKYLETFVNKTSNTAKKLESKEILKKL